MTMRSFGSDRVRESAGKRILHAPIAKGWTARSPRTATSAEHPGTAVLWDDEYFEVVEAAALPHGGIRYVLAPWRDDHTIRTFDRYDEESETLRLADHERAARQRRYSVLARVSSVVLGFLPEPVQSRLQNEIGVSPQAMTLASCILGWSPMAVCVWLAAGAKIEQVSSPVPGWAWLIAGVLLLETFVRFFVAMSQGRGMGSAAGLALYGIYWRLSSRRSQLPSPFESPGETALFMIPPEEHVVLSDSLELRGPLLSLLTPAEQHRLAQRYSFDYRRHATPITWALLVSAAAGAISSGIKLAERPSPGLAASLLIATVVGVEQLYRLTALRRGPAGSMLAPLVRPFVRRLL